MPSSDTLPVIVVGAGGHARVLLDTLRAGRHEVRGLCDSNPDRARTACPDETIVGDDRVVLAMPVDEVAIVIGIGGTRATERRRSLFALYRDAGFRIVSVIHPSAVIARDVVIGAGAQIMAGAVIQPAAIVGENAIVNTRASVDHDCRIGDHAFIAPGVTLCGGVVIGAGAHVGAGATVLEYRSVGAGATVGGGALVNRDVAAGRTVVGVPARTLKG